MSAAVDGVVADVGPVVMQLLEPREVWIAPDDAIHLPWALVARCSVRFTFPGGAYVTKHIKAKHAYPLGSEWADLDQAEGQEAVYAEVLRHLRRHGLPDDLRPDVRIEADNERIEAA